MTAVTERRIVREASTDAERNTTAAVGADVTDSSGVTSTGAANAIPNADAVAASLNGILKGGRLWKSTSDIPQVILTQLLYVVSK